MLWPTKPEPVLWEELSYEEAQYSQWIAHKEMDMMNEGQTFEQLNAKKVKTLMLKRQQSRMKRAPKW